METQQAPSEISFLIRLLDDRDTFVRDRVSDRLLELGPEAAPFLEIASREENLQLRVQAKELLRKIAPKKLAEQFRELSRAGSERDLDLEKGVTLLMQFGHPGSDPQTVTDTLDELAVEFSSRLEGERSGKRLITQLADFLFQEKGFNGNKKNYFNPDNSYIDTVLNLKTGIPITLSALCMFIGQRLDLPMVGVGLPCHFIVKYNDRQDPVFFDPFNAGRILTKEGCAELVRGFGLEFEERYLLPVSQREILIRMVHNLIMIYNRTQEEEKSKQLSEFSHILMNRF